MINKIIRVLKSQSNSAKIYSILYDGRSGSVFLQSLLDNHPRIINFPATVLMGGLTGKHINEFLTDKGPVSWDEFIKNFILAYPTLFDSRIDSSGCRLNELGINRDEHIRVSSEEFSSVMEMVVKEIQYTKRNAFLAIHLVWEYVRKKYIDENPIILYAMHTPEESMKYVVELFPEMRVILSTREPKSTLASFYLHHIKRHEFEGGNQKFWGNEENLSYPVRTLEYFLNCYLNIDKYVEFESVRVVRLEDLHSKPKETMLKVANWMGIEFNDSLLESTFGGLLHWGDITIDYKTGPAYKEMEFDWRRSFYWSDALIIESIFSHRYQNYGYPRDMQFSEDLNSDRKFINLLLESFPMKWEVQSLGSIRSLNEPRLYQLLKNEMVKKSERNLFSKLKSYIKIQEGIKDKIFLPQDVLDKSIYLIEKRKSIIKNYVLNSNFEKRYKLL